MKIKDNSDMAKAISFDTPTFVKKKTVIASRNPSPPIDIGSIVTAPIIGRNMKKYTKSTPRPNALEIK